MIRRRDRDEGALMRKSRRQELGSQRFVLRIVGAGLLVTTGAIHLDLYLTGYRTIPRSAGCYCFR
jgi:hypothetical protein